MSPGEIATMVLGAGTGGAILLRLIDYTRDGIKGRTAKRRAEVDRAMRERAKAIEERDNARKTADMNERRCAEVREDLWIHRRVIIDAPCLGPDHLPEISDASRGK